MWTVRQDPRKEAMYSVWINDTTAQHDDQAVQQGQEVAMGRRARGASEPCAAGEGAGGAGEGQAQGDEGTPACAPPRMLTRTHVRVRICTHARVHRGRATALPPHQNRSISAL